MQNLQANINSGDFLDVRNFDVDAQMSHRFSVDIIAVSESANIDFEKVVAAPATFTIATKTTIDLSQGDLSEDDLKGLVVYSGVCTEIRQIGRDEEGLSTYRLKIEPMLALMSHRSNNRIFQYKTEVEIALQILKEWGIEPEVRLDMGAFKKRKFKVQYEESDLDFVDRMLEEAGVAYFFDTRAEAAGRMILVENPEKAVPRNLALRFVDEPDVTTTGYDWATDLHLSRKVAPGRYTVRDHDYRKAPTYQLAQSSENGLEIEKKLEIYDYIEGAMLFNEGSGEGSETVVADKKGKTRTDENEGSRLAQKRLEALRADAFEVAFQTNAFDVQVGIVVKIESHPRVENDPQLVTKIHMSGGHDGEWVLECDSTSAKFVYRPPLKTPRPVANGVESATVVGPPGEEIHCDEFGRVKVHFHWDRESKMDDDSSCWIHVSQTWGGAGFGGSQLPRVGQEVIVEFLGGDPDRPIIIGRVYTALQTTPYALPANKTQSGLKSNSTGGTGGFNEIMMEDKQGEENLRIRAEKDRNAQVNNNCSTNVGRNRSTKVGGNGSLRVKGNRNVSVGGRQDTMVGGECTLGAVGSLTLSTSDKFGAFAVKTMDIMSGEDMSVTSTGTLTLTAGDGASTIILSKNAIIIDGPKVYVNPGKDQIQNILSTGNIVQPDEPQTPSVIDQLLDKAKQAIDFAKQHPELVAPLVAPLLLPLAPALPLLAPVGIGIAAGEAIRRASTGGGATNPTTGGQNPVFGGGGDFGGGGAGGSW